MLGVGTLAGDAVHLEEVVRHVAGLLYRPMSVTALPDSRAALPLVAPHIHRTPLLTSRTLSEETGFEVRLKAELFQRTGSYKIRGPLVKLARLSQDERERGVVCSSAGNHAQGVALAAAMLGVRAVVCMAANATPSKIAATRGYGAEVVLHGSIWDEADEKARELVASQGLVYVHPFDDVDLISGQGDGRPRDPGGLAGGRGGRRSDRRGRADLGHRAALKRERGRDQDRRRRVGGRPGDAAERRGRRAA